MTSRQPDAAGRQASMCRTTTEATVPRSRVKRRRTAALALLVSGALAGSGATAWAKPLHCGDTVTTNTTLHADLTDCPGNGLVIGADRVTLNLNGHAITGNLEGAVGIDNSAGHDGVTIMNGAVRNFTNGVLLLEHASGNRCSASSSYRTTAVAPPTTES
jgi:hypothetical protein